MAADWWAGDGEGVKVFVLDTDPPDVIPCVQPERVKRFARRSRPALAEHAGRVARVIAARHPIYPGFAPACRLYLAGVVHRSGSGIAVAQALRWALDEGADVVNMSFASLRLPDEVRDLLEGLDRRGTICVASYNRRLPCPHTWPCVVSAGSVDRTGRPDVATEDRIVIPTLHGSEPFTGTSCSAAVVSGVAACMKALTPRLNRPDLLRQLAAKTLAQAS